MARLIVILVFLLSATPGRAGEIESSAGRIEITTILIGLEEPWALAFLPGGGVLVTERGGRLLHRAPDGHVQVVAGTPKVRARGQGGLLDVMVPRDFAQSRLIYLSYARRQPGGSAGTALAVGRLSDDQRQLEDLRVIFEMQRGTEGGRHFGGRIVEAPDGTIFLTVGERGDRPSAQDLTRHSGSVIRVAPDGTVPGDNPFTDEPGALPEIWSYGHRNPQGAALDGAGELWVSEHGAQGGDEVNLVRRGANYGWPMISYGRHYSGAKIGEGTAKAGMEQPAHYWDPSIAPSGLMIYSGRLWPEWEGDFFVGSLKFDMISRLDRRDDVLTESERLAAPETGRVRDVREAPDGSIWFLSVHDGAIYRMAPAGSG